MDHLKPLEEITQKWKLLKNEKDEKESIKCFQACVSIIKKHFDLGLNETKTAYKDIADKTQEELQSIINLIAEKAIDPPNAKESNCLIGAFGVELARYQTMIYREAQRRRVTGANKEHQIEDLLPSMMMKEDDKEVNLEDNNEDEEEEEEEEEGDEADDEEDDDEIM